MFNQCLIHFIDITHFQTHRHRRPSFPLPVPQHPTRPLQLPMLQRAVAAVSLRNLGTWPFVNDTPCYRRSSPPGRWSSLPRPVPREITDLSGSSIYWNPSFFGWDVNESRKASQMMFNKKTENCWRKESWDMGLDEDLHGLDVCKSASLINNHLRLLLPWSLGPRNHGNLVLW